MAKPAKKKVAKTAAKKVAKAAARVSKSKSRPAAKLTASKSKSAKVQAKTKPKAKVQAKPKKTAKAAKAAKAVKVAKVAKPASRKVPIDPLNRKNYNAVTTMLVVQNVRSAVDFYTNAFGFKLRGAMEAPDGSIMHAELSLRDANIMLSPEAPQHKSLSARTIGDTPATLYLLVENVDDVFNRAVAAGAQVRMPLMDMFWGDRCCEVADMEGNKWMLATHISEPTPAQMQEALKEMMSQAASSSSPAEESQAAAASASDLFGNEY